MEVIETPDLSTLDKEKRLQLAVEAYHQDPRLSHRSLALAYNVPQLTLMDHSNGIQTRQESHSHQLKLTVTQETVLAEWIKEVAR